MVLLFVAFAHVRVFHPHMPHTRHDGPPACWRFASAAITRLLFSCHHHDQWSFSHLRAPHAGSSLLACRPVGQGTQLSAICRSRICSRKSQFERPVGLQVGVHHKTFFAGFTGFGLLYITETGPETKNFFETDFGFTRFQRDFLKPESET